MKTKLTERDIEDSIYAEQYYQFPGTTTMVCCLTLCNQFNTVGISACVDPKNFDEDFGREMARQNAKDKIWTLEGYLLRDQLHRIEVLGEEL